MYSILFVDDEQSVLDYLPLAIAWEELGITQMYAASSAQSALAIIQENVPDIILSDVEMEGMNGLAFCKEVKRLWPDVELVILSAFDRFDYAKKAIGMGVEDYLLKPVDEDELWQLMKRIVAGIEASGRRRSHDHLMEQQALEREMAVLLRDLFRAEPIGSSLNERFPFLTQYEDLNIIMRRGDNNTEIRELLRGTLTAQGMSTEDALLHLGEGVYVLLGHGDPLIAMEQRLQTVQSQLNRQGYAVMAAGIRIRREETYEAAFCRCFYELERGFYDSDAALDRTALLPPDLKEALRVLSEEGDISELRNAISAAVDDARQRHAEPVRVCNMLMDVLITLKTYLARTWQEEAMEIFRRITVISLFRCGSLDGMYQMIERCMGEFQYFVSQQQRIHGNSYIVRIAKEYTKEHYQETELSLQDVADATGTSRTYFSRIFKDMTNERYWDYLSRYRIERAKELLRNTNLGQAEISMQVGYASEFHFSRKFKEIVGVSPNRFRKS